MRGETFTQSLSQNNNKNMETSNESESKRQKTQHNETESQIQPIDPNYAILLQLPPFCTYLKPEDMLNFILTCHCAKTILLAKGFRKFLKLLPRKMSVPGCGYNVLHRTHTIDSINADLLKCLCMKLIDEETYEQDCFLPRYYTAKNYVFCHDTSEDGENWSNMALFAFSSPLVSLEAAMPFLSFRRLSKNKAQTFWCKILNGGENGLLMIPKFGFYLKRCLERIGTSVTKSSGIHLLPEKLDYRITKDNFVNYDRLTQMIYDIYCERLGYIPGSHRIGESFLLPLTKRWSADDYDPSMFKYLLEIIKFGLRPPPGFLRVERFTAEERQVLLSCLKPEVLQTPDRIDNWFFVELTKKHFNNLNFAIPTSECTHVQKISLIEVLGNSWNHMTQHGKFIYMVQLSGLSLNFFTKEIQDFILEKKTYAWKVAQDYSLSDTVPSEYLELPCVTNKHYYLQCYNYHRHKQGFCHANCITE
jgi:hypothetical protein